MHMEEYDYALSQSTDEIGWIIKIKEGNSEEKSGNKPGDPEGPPDMP